MMKKTAADSKTKGKKHGSIQGPVWSIAVRERCSSFIQTKLLNSSTLALDVKQVLGSRSYFQSC